MKRKIVPSIIAKNQKELNKRLDKVGDYVKIIHLDVMDGKFVPNKSLNFDFKLFPKLKYEAHLMIENPKEWIEKNHKKVDTIIVHAESVKNKERIINLVRKYKKKIGFALRPETPVTSIKKYLKKIDEVLILDVNPGFYGGKMILPALKKVEEIEKLNKRIKIEIDGHVDDKTIKMMSKTSADYFVSGSYLQKSNKVKKAIEKLRRAIRK